MLSKSKRQRIGQQAYAELESYNVANAIGILDGNVKTRTFKQIQGEHRSLMSRVRNGNITHSEAQNIKVNLKERLDKVVIAFIQ